jgi:hypothetical protein
MTNPAVEMYRTALEAANKRIAELEARVDELMWQQRNATAAADRARMISLARSNAARPSSGVASQMTPAIAKLASAGDNSASGNAANTAANASTREFVTILVGSSFRPRPTGPVQLGRGGARTLAKRS